MYGAKSGFTDMMTRSHIAGNFRARRQESRVGTTPLDTETLMNATLDKWEQFDGTDNVPPASTNASAYQLDQYLRGHRAAPAHGLIDLTRAGDVMFGRKGAIRRRDQAAPTFSARDCRTSAAKSADRIDGGCERASAHCDSREMEHRGDLNPAEGTPQHDRGNARVRKLATIVTETRELAEGHCPDRAVTAA